MADLRRRFGMVMYDAPSSAPAHLVVAALILSPTEYCLKVEGTFWAEPSVIPPYMLPVAVVTYNTEASAPAFLWTITLRGIDGA